jgi:hypothetical protein
MKKGLTEKEAEEFLEKEGFEIIKRETIKNLEEIKKAEKKINYPWVMKISSSKIMHKVKVNGVICNIDTQIKAQEAFEKLSSIENFEEAMIQETAKGEEIIMGIKKVPEFNHVIMFGKGGSKVEEDRDVSFRVLPITVKEAKEMIKEVNFYKILEEKQVNINLILKLVIKLGKLTEAYPDIIELDLNPVFANQETLKIADARIVFG